MVLIALMFTNVPVVLKSPTLTVAALINVANQVLMLYVSSVVKAKSKSAAAINLLVRQQWQFKIGMFVISVVEWHVKIVMTSAYKISWYRNTDGTGNFSSQINFGGLQNHVKSLAVADFDGDGWPDIAAASAFQDNPITWYKNTCSGPALMRESRND